MLLCLDACLVAEAVPKVTGLQGRTVVSTRQVTARGEAHMAGGKSAPATANERRVSFCALAALAWDASLNASECAQQRAKAVALALRFQ